MTTLNTAFSTDDNRKPRLSKKRALELLKITDPQAYAAEEQRLKDERNQKRRDRYARKNNQKA
jgi:hypothetical protein